MIQKFVDRFMEKKGELAAKFAKEHPEGYIDVVRSVVEILHDDADYESIDPGRIHEINDGDYQGTLVYVIGSSEYQPYDYWFVKVAYGSCSACDTLEAIRGYEGDPPNGEQVDGYMTLALHIVQGLESMP